MTTKKQKKQQAKKAAAKKLKILRVEQVAEGTHRVELEIHDHSEPLPPVELLPAAEAPLEVPLEIPESEENPVWKWLKKAWGS